MKEEFKNFKDGMRFFKDIRKSMKDSGLDLSDPKKMMENLGIDIGGLEETFNNQFKQKAVVKYVYKGNRQENIHPTYQYPTDSGFDLRSDEDCIIPPMGRKLVSTGMFFQLPEKYEMQIRPRSGLAIKKGLTVLNSPGTLDNNYVGEVKIILINLSQDTQTISVGDRIAQAVICPVIQGAELEYQRVNKLEKTDRGEGGFGSTGEK